MSSSSASPPREITSSPESSSLRTTPTILVCASSTTRRRCGGMYSISSRSISAPRCDMLSRIFDWTSSDAPRIASPRSFESTSRSTIWIERPSNFRMSSKTKRSDRTSFATSSSSVARCSRMLRSVERFAAFRIAASERTPPQAALGDVAASVRGRDHLLHHRRRELWLDGLHLGHLDRQLLDHLVRQVPEDLCCALRAERDEQDRGLAPARQARG